MTGSDSRKRKQADTDSEENKFKRDLHYKLHDIIWNLSQEPEQC